LAQWEASELVWIFARITTFNDRTLFPVMGLIIGALFVSFTSWPWVFYFSASVSGVIGVSAILLIPNLRRTVAESRAQKILRLRRLDLLGVLMFTGKDPSMPSPSSYSLSIQHSCLDPVHILHHFWFH
jgi:MFS family permease